ncbi:MAG: hypothetical protein ACPGJV_04115 [Bacteriovoracaceae bacterium]
MRNLSVILILLLIQTWFCSKLEAYIQMAGHGYHNCLTCHYNPAGGGPVSDYGRAAGATILSDKVAMPDSYSEEDLAYLSSFSFKKPKNTWLRPYAGYRGLNLQSNFGEDSEESEWIHMTAFAGTAIQSKNAKTWVFWGSISYVPDDRSPTVRTDKEEPNFRSREYVYGQRIGKNLGVYLGLMDKTFGLRVPDHNLSSRAFTGLAENDQSHGALLHYNYGNFEGMYHYFLGNVNNSSEVKQAGWSTLLNYSFSKKFQLGFSYLSSASELTKRNAVALMGKYGINDGSSMNLEVGLTSKKGIFLSSLDKEYQYLFMQNFLRLQRGLYALLTIERLTEDSEDGQEIYLFGPGIQYFPMPKVELRLEVYDYRTINEDYVSEDTWAVLSQVHLWL